MLYGIFMMKTMVKEETSPYLCGMNKNMRSQFCSKWSKDHLGCFGPMSDFVRLTLALELNGQREHLISQDDYDNLIFFSFWRPIAIKETQYQQLLL